MHFQGQIAEAESMFNMMKIDGLHPDVIAYTAMLHAYSAAGGYTSVSFFNVQMLAEFTEFFIFFCRAMGEGFCIVSRNGGE